jgi:NTE family protein
MLQALTDRGILPEAVYGASVGAINGGGFAGRPDEAGVEHLAEVWRTLTRESIFPQGRVPATWRFLQHRESVHANSGLRRVLEEGLAFERMEDAALHFEVVTTSLASGRPRWFFSGSAVDAILASAALPAIFPPVTIDGEALVDGGVVDNVPMRRAFAQGAERVFVLLCNPLHPVPVRARRPVEAVLSALSIAVHARFARELEDLPEGKEVVLFTVESDAALRYDDFSGTETLMAAGRASAEAVLDFWESGGIGESTGRTAERLHVPEPFDVTSAPVSSEEAG